MAPNRGNKSDAHVAYRVLVRTDSADGPLSGLYFDRSDVDRSVMSWAGNLLTDFRFHTATIHMEQDEAGFGVRVWGSRHGEGDVDLRVDAAPGEPAAGRTFASKEVREAILRYRPLGLAVAKSGRIRLARVERDEGSWSEDPVRVVRAGWGFFAAWGGEDLRLERATRVAPLEYRWRIGETVAPE